MGEEISLRLGIDVQDQELLSLERRIDNLKNKPIDMRINGDAITREINAITSKFKQITNISINPRMDTSGIKQSLNEMSTLFKRMKDASRLGLDSASIFNNAQGGMKDKSKALRDAANQAARIQREINQAFQSAGSTQRADFSQGFTQGVQRAISSLQQLENEGRGSFQPIISNARQASQAMQQYSQVVQQSTRSSESLDRTEQQARELDSSLNNLANNQGLDEVREDATRANQEITRVSGTLDALNNALTATQRVNLFEALKTGLAEVGVSVEGTANSLNQFVRHVTASFSSGGQLISASVRSIVDQARVLQRIGSVADQESGEVFYHVGSTRIDDSTRQNNIKRVQQLYKELIKLNNELATAEEKGNAATAADINQKITARQNEINVLRQQLQGIQEVANAERQYNEAVSSRAARSQDAARNAQEKNNLKEMIRSMNEYVSIQQKVNTMQRSETFNSAQIAEYQQRLNSLKETLSSLGVTFNEATGNFALGENIQMSVQRMNELNNAIRNVNNSLNMQGAQQSDIADQAKIQAAINKYKELNQARIQLARAKMTGSSTQEIERLTSDVERLRSEFVQLSHQTVFGNNIVGQTDQVRNAMRETYRETQNTIRGMEQTANATSRLQTGFDGILSRVMGMGASMLIFTQIQNAIFSAGDAIKELDTAMTDLQMVTERSDQSIRNMMSSYASMAKDLGVTLQSVAEGSAEWLRQGFSTAETEELLRASTMLATVGNMEASASTEALTSILNGFNMEASNAINVVDTLNALDLKYATSSEELAVALQRVAAVASTAGVSFNDLASIITVVSSNTRLSAETIGNGIKSLFSRLQNVKVGKYLDLETGEQLNDTERVKKPVSLQLFIDLPKCA